MNAAEVIVILQEMSFLILKLSAPMVLTALVLGMVVSLIQAITQIQEMTLTFVPKFVAVIAMGLIVLPYLVPSFETFTRTLFVKITNSGGINR
ncbi:MAG: flagellar biosynthetic protein FliQ [Alphaproteobacteria bacterium]|nr:flagellar biosynthetic protein FliQ [Alphaproteobacteria bacterium]HCU06160.1 EscS/YscS/HrcS family type III secretion system export apparatus protein [Holosporales bacterium]